MLVRLDKWLLVYINDKEHVVWWGHQMETFSTLLALCAENSPVNSEFPSQRPVMWSFDVFFDLPLNKSLSKQLWGWWFEIPLCSLWCHCNGQHALGTMQSDLGGQLIWRKNCCESFGRTLGPWRLWLLTFKALISLIPSVFGGAAASWTVIIHCQHTATE